MAVSITKQKQGKIFLENILIMFVILSQTKRLRNLDNLLVALCPINWVVVLVFAFQMSLLKRFCYISH